jgi:hypothetical protein
MQKGKYPMLLAPQQYGNVGKKGFSMFLGPFSQGKCGENAIELLPRSVCVLGCCRFLGGGPLAAVTRLGRASFWAVQL